jgi:hypothetical protein
MAAPPRFKTLFAEDFKDAPEWFLRFVSIFNEVAQPVTNALTGRLTRRENMLSVAEPFDFTTLATAANTFPLRFKNKLSGTKPTIVQVASFAKHTGGTLSAAWSVSSVINQNNEIELTFQGLENSTRYVGVLVYE